MADQSVTGSCQQCGRKYALRVPGPGSGDLELQRVAEVFGWCVECGQLVGRACCWGSARTCARCADARATAGDAKSGFAALGAARAAVRHLDGTGAGFAAVEDAVAGTLGARPNAALGAWQVTWLVAGALRARIDGAADAATWSVRAIPPAEVERAAELEEELGMVAASLEGRWVSLTEVITEAGRRLARRRTHNERRRRLGLADGSAQPTPLPVAADADAAPRPGTARGRVAFRVPVAIHAPVTATEAPTASQTAAPVATPDSVDDVPVGLPRRSPARGRVTSRVPIAIDAPSPSRLAVATTATATEAPPAPTTRTPPTAPPDAPGQSNAPIPAAPARAPEPAAGGASGRRRGTAAVALVAIVGIALAGGMVAGVIGPIGSDSEDAGGRAPSTTPAPSSDAAIAAPGSATPPSPQESPTGSDVRPPTVITVDLHPVGPLDPEELPFTRIIGAPEVATFPTSFDRSLRLTGTAAGFCVALASASTSRAQSMGFDLHLRKAGGLGRLAVGLPPNGPASATGLAIDLAALGGLDPEAWYRLTVTGGEPGRLEVTGVEDDRLVLEAELGGDATMVPVSTDEVCIHASLQSPEASLLVDNLRVDR